MQITRYPDATAFLADNQHFLEEEEAINNMLLGFAFFLQKEAEKFRDALIISISKKEEVVFVAVQAFLQPMIVYGRNLMEAELVEIAKLIIGFKRKIPVLLGPKAVALTLTRHISKLQGTTFQVTMNSRVYELEQVLPVSKTPGHLRLADPAELPYLTKWMQAFILESLGSDHDLDATRSLAKGKIERGELYLWEHQGQAITMAATARPTTHYIAVNYVYTPPELRRRGFASNCVAALSQRMLDAGYKRCTLFTDLDNPTTSGLYERIGYRSVGEFIQFDLKGEEAI